MKYIDIICKMTLEEKVSLTSGKNFWNTMAISRLGIPSIMLTDGPHGLRKQAGKADHLGLNKSVPATCFPTAATLASSWDTALLTATGQCLGEEAVDNNVNVVLGPGLNIKRNPLCGRNFEYFSEDPYLAGKLAAAMITGIQSRGISACPKHFAVNSQEERRMVIDEIVDERALREIYLEGFRYAVQEGKPKTLMTSYNRVNGTFANENEHLLKDILAKEWGYDGVIVTDWGGEVDRIAGLKAGNQLEMPSSNGMTNQDLFDAVRSGTLDENLLNERVDTLLELIFTTQIRPDPMQNETARQTQNDANFQEAHHLFARKTAADCIVLLKNQGQLLPLSQGTKIAVIGDFAVIPRYQGAGSSLINPTRLDNALEELQKTALSVVGYAQGFKRYGGKSEKLLQGAVNLAKTAEVTVLFMGLDESREAEGVDRADMRLADNQTELLHALKGVGGKLVVVLCGGSPIEMPWRASADALLATYLGGQAGAGAIADILTGVVCPSGKLAETYPEKYEDVPFHGEYPSTQMTSLHKESLFVGYRYYDSARKNVAFPFGFGLSYTTFAYKDIALSNNQIRFTVCNTGDVAGAEIAQMYVSHLSSKIFRAKQELKGFAKIFLQPGEEKPITLPLDEHAFCYFNTAENSWCEEAGIYEINVGASSRDIRLTVTALRSGCDAKEPYSDFALPSYRSLHLEQVTDGEFEQLVGHPLPLNQWNCALPLGYHDTLGQGKHKKGLGRFLYRLICLARKCCFLFGKPIAANNIMFAMHLPFLRLARMSGGRITLPMLDGILVMFNGHFFRGLAQTFKAWRKKSRETVSHQKVDS